MNNYYFTSESVTEGHPDKLCLKVSFEMQQKFNKKVNEQ